MTRPAVYVERNVDLRSCNHCCSGKAINITYSESVFVALGIQHARCMLYFFICGLSGFTIFVHISQRHDLKKKKILYIKCPEYF